MSVCVFECVCVCVCVTYIRRAADVARTAVYDDNLVDGAVFPAAHNVLDLVYRLLVVHEGEEEGHLFVSVCKFPKNQRPSILTIYRHYSMTLENVYLLERVRVIAEAEGEA